RRIDGIKGTRATEPVERFDLVIDAARRRVTRAGEEVQLTPLEFEILLTLARSPGTVFGRDQLMDRIWGYRDYAGGRVVDSHVARIRRKLHDEAAEPKYVRTVHGVGYAFQEDEDHGPPLMSQGRVGGSEGREMPGGRTGRNGDGSSGGPRR